MKKRISFETSDDPKSVAEIGLIALCKKLERDYNLSEIKAEKIVMDRYNFLFKG